MIKRKGAILPFILIVVGMIFFSWNAITFYEGYRAPTELKIENHDVEKRIHSPIFLQTGIDRKALYRYVPKIGEKVGDLLIPKLNQTIPVYQGTGPDVLKKGAGHVESSAMPGEQNNAVISGHRDTVFRGLKDLERNDRLIFSMGEETFLYKVKKIRIVDADDQTVLTPKPRGILTVTTCYPFYYLGDAPERYIITAELISQKH